MADIRAALAGDKPDRPTALVLLTWQALKAHSVARFADNYNGRLERYLAAAAKHSKALTGAPNPATIEALGPLPGE